MKLEKFCFAQGRERIEMKRNQNKRRKKGKQNERKSKKKERKLLLWFFCAGIALTEECSTFFDNQKYTVAHTCVKSNCFHMYGGVTVLLFSWNFSR